MLPPRSREEALDLTEHELVQARALALGRTARKLESYLTALERLRRRIPAARAPSRQRLVADFEHTYQLAALWRWYLVNQREANGMSNCRFDEHYPMPARLSPM